MTSEQGLPGPSARWEVFSGGRARTTAGLLLVITAVAFEGMGVATAMPAVMADIGSLETYAWPFVAFTTATVFATVLAGRWADRSGPAGAIVVGVTTFTVGLVVAATAFTLTALLIGRVLQGLGAGAATVAIFVLIAQAYPAGLRAAVLGWTASAWVVPSLLGPPIAAYISQTWSWHWVFGGIAPLAALALVMMARTLRTSASTQVRPDREPPPGRRWLLLAALGAAIGVAALSWAGEDPGLSVLPVAVTALVIVVPSVRYLVPRGTLRASRGVGTTVLARGMLAGTYFSMNAFLPLMLTTLYGWSLTSAGTTLIPGSLGWSLASAWQGGRPNLPRHRLLQLGFVFLGVGVIGVMAVTVGVLNPWMTMAAQAIAGLGMGLGMPSVLLLVMGHSAPENVGFNTSAAQILDGVSAATLIGVGGALTAAMALQPGYLALLAGLVLLVALGALLAPRAALATPSVAVDRDA